MGFLTVYSVYERLAHRLYMYNINLKLILYIEYCPKIYVDSQIFRKKIQYSDRASYKFMLIQPIQVAKKPFSRSPQAGRRSIYPCQSSVSGGSKLLPYKIDLLLARSRDRANSKSTNYLRYLWGSAIALCSTIALGKVGIDNIVAIAVCCCCCFGCFRCFGSITRRASINRSTHLH